jgi:ABC-type Zn uptake system ZnuABC Zn-binding protein ZnuA
MRRRPFILGLAACCLWGVVIGGVTAAPARPLRVVVTTSLIETALRDLMSEPVEIVRLLPAGSCPGHFDLEPSQLKAMAGADAFIRHDFQAGLDEAVARAGVTPDRTISVTSLPAFTIPSNYVAMCKELAENMAVIRPELKDALAVRLGDIEARAVEAERTMRIASEKLRGHKVLAAHYQRDFCEWLGLSVVAVFHAGTDESAWRLNRAVDMARAAGAEAVVGNLQWGSKHLRALCEATRLPGAMLSNFPETGEDGAYWELLKQNVCALLRIWNGNGH